MSTAVSFDVRPEFEHFDQPRIAWFCAQTQNRHEEIAAASLKQDPDIEVFLPRIRFRRTTRFGAGWATEALFQNYLFARFDFDYRLRRVQHARGIRGVVHFGNRWPVVPQQVIDELRRVMGENEVRLLADEPEPGELVQIAGGPLDGLEAIVTRIMPGPKRVAVLLEFLGRQTTVELSRQQVVRQTPQLFPDCLACS